MSTRAIARSTLWQVASQVTMAALSIVTVKFVALGLTKELAGNYNSAYGFLQLFGILADFGLYAVAVREVSKAGDRKEEVLGTLFVLRTIILVFSLGTALFFVWILPQWRGTPLPLSVTFASLVPFFTLLAGMIRTVFQMHYAMHYVFIAEVSQRIVTVLLIGAVVLTGVRESSDVFYLHYFLLVGGIGALVLFLLSFIFGSRFMRIRFHWNLALFIKVLKTAAPYGLAFLCMALYRQFDITLIALLRPDFDLQNAYYGFVLRMADMGFLLPTFLLNSVLPILSEQHSKGEETRDLLGKTFLIILLIGSTSMLFSLLWPRPLIQLLTTDAYLSTATAPGSDTALWFLSFPLFLNGMILYSFYVLLTKHAWRRLVATLCAGAVLSLTLNLWLIPTHGFVGASITSIVVHAVLACLLFPQALRVLPMHFPRRHVLQWAGYTALLAGGLWLLQPFLTNEIATVIGLVSATGIIVASVLLTGLRDTLTQ